MEVFKMFCKNCGTKLEDGSAFCSSCGTKVDGGNATNESAYKNAYVRISCPVCPGQLFNNACVAYNSETGAELARCKQGEVLTFRLSKPTEVQVSVKGSFGKPSEVMRPGDTYKIGYRGFGKIYLAKVDAIF